MATEETKKRRKTEEEYKQTIEQNIERSKKRLESIDKGESGDARRLGFILDIANALGYNLREFGALSGTSPQMMTWIFNVRDNCNLSKAREILAGAGLDLGVTIETTRKTGTTGAGGVQMQVNTSIRKKTITTEPDWFRELENSSHPLHFLYDFYLQVSPANVTVFCRGCKISHDDGTVTTLDTTSLRYYISKKDIPVSQIYNIARSYDGKIIWNITQK